MATTRIQVSSAVLEWALSRAGDRGSDLRAQYNAWLLGETEPTLRQLEKFASETHVPFGYLLLSEPPHEELPIPLLRTKPQLGTPHFSRELLDTVHTMQLRQAWMRDELLEQGQEPLPFVRSAVPRDASTDVAARIRQTLGLGASWAAERATWEKALYALRKAIEDAGILVSANGIVGNNTHRVLSVEEFRGFVLVDEYAPLIFVNAADAKSAQMFTLAHELAHVWLGVSAAFDLRELHPAHDPHEEACDKIAAEVLVPATELREAWSAVASDPEPFERLARHFKVSSIVVARRMLDARLIDRDRFLRFYKAEQQRDHRHRPQPGNSFYATQRVRLGRRFSEAVVRAARAGRVLYDEAYSLTGLRGRTFDRYADTVMELPA